MRILVTGGAGYIGSVLVPMLLAEGHEVTVVDNFMYSQTSLLDCCGDARLRIIRGDAQERALMAGCVREAEAIFPLACLTGAPACDADPAEAKRVNLDAIHLLLELRSPDQRIIFPTTNSGYGVGGNGAACTEETPLRPISRYGRLKAEAEQAVLAAKNSITLRLATAFGISPRMRLDLLVNDFVYRAVTDGFVVLFQGDFMRNYIHVRDVARAFLHCLGRFEQLKDEPYNVGLSDANLSKRELCEAIKKQIPQFYVVEAEVGQDPDQRDYLVSNAKIEATGYRATVSLERGIAELVKGYQVVRRNGFANV